MASKQDTANRKSGSDESQMSHNQQVAESQSKMTSFRAGKVALNSDAYNPERLQPVNHL